MIVHTTVNTDPAHAFEIFTDGINHWWKRTTRHLWRNEPDVKICFEGNHLLEVHSDATFVLGSITVWEPGKRLIFTWLAPQPPTTVGSSEVEVRFEPLGDQTRIVLEHRGIPGTAVGDALTSVIGLWWSDLLIGFAAASK